MGPIHLIFGGSYWLLNRLSRMVSEFVFVMVMLLESNIVLGCPLKTMVIYHLIFGGTYWLLNTFSRMVSEFVLVMVLLLKSDIVLGCPLKTMVMSRLHVDPLFFTCVPILMGETRFLCVCVVGKPF